MRSPCTVLDWYRAGVDVQPRMPLLATYLGHYAGDRVKSDTEMGGFGRAASLGAPLERGVVDRR